MPDMRAETNSYLPSVPNSDGGPIRNGFGFSERLYSSNDDRAGSPDKRCSR